jgi:broad specificity phosphatase PhoE
MSAGIEIPRDCTCGYPVDVRFHKWDCRHIAGLSQGHLFSYLETELRKARNKFPDFNSPHEGYAVIAEEVEELWEHVKANTGRSEDALEEAIQVAAMALRYALDLCGNKTDSEPVATPSVDRPGPEGVPE